VIKWGSPSDEIGETEAQCHSRCGTIKILPWSKALSAELRPKIFILSPVITMYTPTYGV
jgi:hypothetical protein